MNQTILFLASEPIIREVISEALESQGYLVQTAGDVGSALDRLKECTPDLLMVRHYVEDISGYDAAVYLRARCPGIPVLMVGGLLDDDRLENPALAQGFEIFPKPFRASELLDKVKEVLAKGLARNRADHDWR